MPTLVMDPAPAELKTLLDRRRRLGLDHRDEMWEGVLHMMPPPSSAHEDTASQLHVLLRPLAHERGLRLLGTVGIGTEHDHRVPDLVAQRPPVPRQWHPTAPLLVEIVSPGDETWEKLPFYAAHEVEEVLIVDPAKRSIDWLRLAGGEYRPIRRSALIDLGPGELAERIDWPAVT